MFCVLSMTDHLLHGCDSEYRIEFQVSIFKYQGQLDEINLHLLNIQVPKECLKAIEKN